MKNIKKANNILYRDLTSGNAEGIGLGYPNCVDWDAVNTWSTKLWREMTGDIENIFYITPGTTAMLSYLADFYDETREDKNIIVYMLAPYYSGAFEIFSHRNKVRVFDTVAEMCIALEGDCSCQRFVYVVPTCRNPDGYTMTDDEVKSVINSARVHNTIIVEDDPYFFLSNMVAEPVGRFLCGYERTIYLNSLSKCLGAPGTRVGCFACSDRDLEKRIWEDMMKKFIYPDPSKIAFLMTNMDIEKVVMVVAKIREEITLRGGYFNYEGFYLWKKKDNKYLDLISRGFRVKEGKIFGEKFADYYRASLNHVPRDSAEYAELKKIFIYD